MATSRELELALRARGLRMTVQRRLILDAISSAGGHISAEAVHRRVAERFPDVNLSTVYRTLEMLEELGLMTHTHFHNGVAQYHLAEHGAHQHLVCRGCGSEAELDLALLQPLAAKLRQRYGFEAELGHVALVGLCRACRGGA